MVAHQGKRQGANGTPRPRRKCPAGPRTDLMSLIGPAGAARFLFLWGFLKENAEFQESLQQVQISRAHKEEFSR